MLINFVDATNDANHYTKPPIHDLCRTTSVISAVDEFLVNLPAGCCFPVINSSTGSQRRRYSARHYAVRNVAINDAELTTIKIPSLLARQTYSVRVAAKTRAGVGAFSEILVNTHSFNVRTYQHFTVVFFLFSFFVRKCFVTDISDVG